MQFDRSRVFGIVFFRLKRPRWSLHVCSCALSIMFVRILHSSCMLKINSFGNEIGVALFVVLDLETSMSLYGSWTCCEVFSATKKKMSNCDAKALHANSIERRLMRMEEESLSMQASDEKKFPRPTLHLSFFANRFSRKAVFVSTNCNCTHCAGAV